MFSKNIRRNIFYKVAEFSLYLRCKKHIAPYTDMLHEEAKGVNFN